MGHYGHDMDHDGKVTSKDSGMFHEMMEESNRSNNYSHKSTGDIIGECLFLLMLVLVVPLLFISIVGGLGSLFN